MNKSATVLLSSLTLGALVATVALSVGSPAPVTAAPAPAPAAAADGTFKVDPVHSSVIFKVKHMNVANFYGRFNEVSGTFTGGEKASIDVTVKAESVDTNNKARDQHVISPDFFSAKEFPNITFVAKDLAGSGQNTWKGKGDLTFRSVTKPVEITLVQTGTGKGRNGGELVGLETTFTIKRSDFGNTKEGLSDDVTLTVALECGQAAAPK